MSRLKLKRGVEEEFEKMFLQRARLVDGMKGFVSVEVLKNPGKGEYVVVSRWRSREDYEAWLKSPEYREAHSRIPKPLAENKPQVEIYEVVEA